MILSSILSGCANTAAHNKESKATLAAPLVVRITGENYQWQIRYPGEDRILQTEDDVVAYRDIHMPTNRDVRFELMSNDLLYTLTLEEKGLDEMAVPGMTFTFDLKSAEEGNFEFLGSHMCGLPRQDLNGVFVIESESSFDNWLSIKKKEGAGSPGMSGSFEQPSEDYQGLETDPPILGEVPEFELTDQFGEVFSSINLTGKVWVANFIFTRCPSTCPLQMARMKQIQDKILQHPAAYKTTLISVTVDPDYDQPSILKEHAENFNVNQAHWKFLTGSRDEIWDLSKDGFKLAVGKQPDRESTLLFHSIMMVLVDDLGRIRGYYSGITNEGEEALMGDLDKVLKEEHPDWIAVPSSIMNPPWLSKMQKEQFQSALGRPVFYDFRFSDSLEESGIDFRHQITDESGITYKANHYDHGNGLCVADIDLDGLYDIYFVSQLGGNRLYRNLGGGKFKDVTERAGLARNDTVGASASFADMDNDGDADLFVTTVRSGNVLFENDGSGRFRDITKAAGLTYSGHSSGAVFFDYDRDGLLDLFLTNVGNYTLKNKVSALREGKAYTYYEGMLDAFAGHLKPERSEASILYQNLGNGRFKDVSKQMQLIDESWSGDASMLDANEDGWPDLYILNMQGHDHYYENNKGEYFTDRTQEVFPKTPWGSMGIKVFDHNNDGMMDIYVTDMHSDMSKRIGPATEKYKPPKIYTEYYTQSDGKSIYGNAFFENTGGGRFREISDRLGVETYWPWGPSVGDLNADGYEDIFVASGMNYPWRYAVNKALLNMEGKEYLDAEFLLGIEPRRDGKTAKAWFSLDCSGKDRMHVDCKFQKGAMTVWGALGSRSSAIFDLDNDGDLDIVTNEFNSVPMVLVSDLTEKKEIHFLKVILVGSESNKSGIGATIKVSAGGQTYTRFHDGKSGHLSQSLAPIYFGLGNARTVDRIEVIWPSGKRQVKEGPIKANTLVEITEQIPVEQVRTHYDVFPGEDIQKALELAALDPKIKVVKVHAGTYRPLKHSQAMVVFNARHDGITLEADGEVILTAANADIADPLEPSYPAVVNHVVFFGDGVTQRTILRGFKITGANNYVNRSDPNEIEPYSPHPQLEKDMFFYTDGGGIKIFGRSYPVIENVEIFDNYTSPCGAGISIEQRGFNDKAVTIRNSIFRNNQTQITGSAVDVLKGSSAVIENSLFFSNVSNKGIDFISGQDRGGVGYNEKHGSGALTVFPQSSVRVKRCTFTGNWNGVDDKGVGSVYTANIFWKNNLAGGISPGERYELDILNASGVQDNFIHGDIDDLRGSIDREKNFFGRRDPEFDSEYRPQNKEFKNYGYDPDKI